MAHIVIVGAGPTGLSAAYHLEQLGFNDYKLFEKEKTIGGLCRSIHQDGFTFDYTGHFLHINDDYFRSFIKKLVGFEHFNHIIRRAFVYSHGIYTSYPFQVNLFGLPEDVIVECIEGFVARNKSRKKIHSFPEWVEKQFGAGFAKHFFMPYQKKIFAYDLHKISDSWTGRFVPQTSLKQIIKGAIKPPKNQAIGYNAQFLYPHRGGIQFWLEKIAEHIKQPIYTDYSVKCIDLNNKTIHLQNGHIEPFTYLINTMPLDELLTKLIEKPSQCIKRAQRFLRCNQVINFNFGLKRETLSTKHWIYYPEKKYRFYRIGFPHNFSAHMAPAKCSSISGEIAHLDKSSQWITAASNKALRQIKELFDISKTDIVTQKIIYIKHAYVIYDFWREKHLDSLLKTLAKNDIYCAGRYAQWKYASMQEAILDGKQVVEQILIKPATLAWYTDMINPTQIHEQRYEQ